MQTTLNDILEKLLAMPSEAALVFMTNAGEIGSGYHLTEIKRSSVESINCGANIRNWQESSIQLLDGQGGSHMTVGKFTNIVRQSMSTVKEIDNLPTLVEFAHSNAGLQRYQIGDPELQGNRVYVDLIGEHAVCKPATSKPTGQTAAGCCGGSTSQEPACCT